MKARWRNAVLAVGVCLSVALFGCGGSKDTSTSEPAAEAPAEESVEQEEEPAQASTELKQADLEVSGCDYHYELAEVGSFAGDSRSVSFQYDGAIGYNDAGEPLLLGIDGKPLLDGTVVRGIEYWAQGIYMASIEAEDINDSGLVSLTEGTIIPCEAATVAYATDDPADARFVEVVYATEPTENEDECFIYSTDKIFSMSIDEGDTMYKGYAKVFDLKERAFVEGVEIDNGSKSALTDLGDAFVVEGKDGTYTMYDPKGKELWSSESMPSFGLHSLASNESGAYQIIDATGKSSFVGDSYLSTIRSTSDLYAFSADDAMTIINSEGGVVLDGAFANVSSECNGLFIVKEGDTTKVVNPKGKAIFEEEKSCTISGIIPGYLLVNNNDDNTSRYLKSDGTVIEDVDGSMYDLVSYKDDSYLVLKDGTYSLTLQGASKLDFALVEGCPDGASKSHGLYDLFTGEALLDPSYEEIDWAGGYVYALKDGTWTVYEAKRVLA